MTLGGRTFPRIDLKAFKQSPRANAGREGTPVLTVVTPDSPRPEATPAPVTTGGSLIDEIVRSPEHVQRYTYLIWTCHNIERIADRVTNVCERVIFMVTGQLQEINVSRY